MTAHATRMLLLGAVGMFEPVNGYQIRRELVSWQVDRWANVNPGSIYNGLATLANLGHLARHALREGNREVAVYELTDSGRAELRRLVGVALETVEQYDRTAFMIAFSLMPTVMTSEQARAALVRRRVSMEQAAAEFLRERSASEGTPPHVLRGLLLWYDMAVAELAWLREVIEDLRQGNFPATDTDWDGRRPPTTPVGRSPRTGSGTGRCWVAPER